MTSDSAFLARIGDVFLAMEVGRIVGVKGGDEIGEAPVVDVAAVLELEATLPDSTRRALMTTDGVALLVGDEVHPTVLLPEARLPLPPFLDGLRRTAAIDGLFRLDSQGLGFLLDVARLTSLA